MSTIEKREYIRKTSDKRVIMGSVCDANIAKGLSHIAKLKNVTVKGICLSIGADSKVKLKDFISVQYRKKDGSPSRIRGQIKWMAVNGDQTNLGIHIVAVE